MVADEYGARFQILVFNDIDLKGVNSYFSSLSNIEVVYEAEHVWSASKVPENCRRLGVNEVAGALVHDLYFCVVVLRLCAVDYLDPSATSFACGWGSGEIAFYSRDKSEYLFISSLLLGAEIATNPINRELQGNRKDLLGSSSWRSIKEFCSVLNCCLEWVVLRNFEFLPDNFWGNDKDIDLLCSDIDLFERVANAQRKGNGISNFTVSISDKTLPIDARFIGDGYYDKCWQRDMLTARVIKAGVPILCLEDHYYSLFYHAKLHKKAVKPEYFERLCQLAAANHVSLTPEDLTLDEKCVRLIDAFLKRKGYVIEFPRDISCHMNFNKPLVAMATQKGRERYSWYSWPVLRRYFSIYVGSKIRKIIGW